MTAAHNGVTDSHKSDGAEARPGMLVPLTCAAELLQVRPHRPRTATLKP
jgi:hypothetical protein